MKAINFADSFTIRMMRWGISKLKIPGADIAGMVEAVGRNVKKFKPGDEVYAELGVAGSRARQGKSRHHCGSVETMI